MDELREALHVRGDVRGSVALGLKVLNDFLFGCAENIEGALGSVGLEGLESRAGVIKEARGSRRIIKPSILDERQAEVDRKTEDGASGASAGLELGEGGAVLSYGAASVEE